MRKDADSTYQSFKETKIDRSFNRDTDTIYLQKTANRERISLFKKEKNTSRRKWWRELKRHLVNYRDNNTRPPYFGCVFMTLHTMLPVLHFSLDSRSLLLKRKQNKKEGGGEGEWRKTSSLVDEFHRHWDECQVLKNMIGKRGGTGRVMTYERLNARKRHEFRYKHRLQQAALIFQMQLPSSARA